MGKIFCLYNNKNKLSSRRVENALFYHKDWQRRCFSDPDITLGIFELPFKAVDGFWYEDDGIIAVMDGEIMSYRYSFEELTTMESIVYLYRKFGAAIVNYLNGNFSIIIWEKKERRLTVLNDRLGTRPLYYTKIKDKLIICSEIKGIIADPEFKKELKLQALIDLFTYEFILGNDTLFKGIYVFPYASTMQLSFGVRRSEPIRYWDADFRTNGFQYTADEYIERFKDVIQQAVDRSVCDYPEIGIGLSGGLDSRMISAVAVKRGVRLRAFTFGERGCEDEIYARKVGRVLGIRHRYVGIKYGRLADFINKSTFYCDGLAVQHHFLVLNILQELQRYVNVMLDGFIGDILAGDNRYLLYRDKTDKDFYSKKLDSFGEGLRRRVFSKDLSNEIEKARDRFFLMWEEIKKIHAESPFDYLNFTQRQRRSIIYGKVIIRNYLEARIPFFDYDFLDFCMSMPSAFKENQFAYKNVLIRYFPRLAKVACQARGFLIEPGRLTKALKWRIEAIKDTFGIKQHDTYDCSQWYRTTLKDFVCSNLLSRRFKGRGLFNFDEVAKLLEAHFKGKANYDRQISILLNFELWSRLFYDKSAIEAN